VLFPAAVFAAGVFAAVVFTAAVFAAAAVLSVVSVASIFAGVAIRTPLMLVVRGQRTQITGILRPSGRSERDLGSTKTHVKFLEHQNVRCSEKSDRVLATIIARFA
jgi:hypothetical protein